MNVEKGMLEGGESGKMESSSAADNCQTAPSFHSYPPPLATYEDVFSSRELFMETLRKLHVSMGTKFMYDTLVLPEFGNLMVPWTSLSGRSQIICLSNENISNFTIFSKRVMQ